MKRSLMKMFSRDHCETILKDFEENKEHKLKLEGRIQTLATKMETATADATEMSTATKTLKNCNKDVQAVYLYIASDILHLASNKGNC